MTKKIYFILTGLIMMMFASQVQAQLLVEENFEYGVGSLLTANGWTAHSGAGTNSIEVTSGLTFSGYKGSDIGGAANLEGSGEDLNKTFTEKNSGNIYAAILVNVSSATTTGDYFFHFGPTVIGTTFRAKVFVKKDAENKLYFGVSQNTNNANYSTTSYNLNTTYLLVLKYSIIEGTANDVASVYVASQFPTSEPTTGWLVNSDVAQDVTNIGTVVLRQGTASTAPALKIDGIRVANSWTEAVAPAGVSTKVSTPNLSPGGGSYASPIQVSISSATDGASIYYTLDGSAPDNTKTLYTAPIQVAATTTINAIAYKTGLDASNVASATYTFPTEVSNIAALRANSTGLFKLTGEAVLTFKTADRNAKYIQDATGGILIDDASNILKTNYNIGDGITGITGTLSAYSGMLQFIPVADPGAASSTGNTVTPKEVKLDEMANYPGQLVKVSGVTIDGEGVFAARTNYTLNGSSTTVLRTAYNDLPYIDAGIPAGPQDITGLVLIFNATTQLVPRTINDFKATVITEPTLVVTEVMPLFGVNFGQSLKDTVYVDGFNLTANVTVALSGDGAAAFTVSPSTLTPTNGTLTDAAVEIIYNPATAGDHVASLTFSSAGAADVVKTLTGKAFSMSGDGTADRPFTVGDVISMNNSLGNTQKYWVKGYIVGSAGGGTGGVLTSVATVAPFSPSALAIAASATETSLAAMVPVQLPVGDVRAALNLLDNPAQLGKEVRLYGTLEAYFTAPGVKNVTEYAILTSLPALDANRFVVASANGQLLIHAATTTSVEVYNTVGQRLYSGVLSQGLNTVEVNQSGMLLVKIEGAIQKVVL